MKKSVLITALLLWGFFGFGQNNKPYLIRYQSQGDTIQHNIQSVSSIHIDTLGQELIYDNGTEWSSLTDMDTVFIYRGDEIVNPMYVPIDWDEASLVQSNVSLGIYQIRFNGEVPELRPGSIIAIREGIDIHYAFIETTDVNGSMVTITTTVAYLTDIFADKEFTLSTRFSERASAKENVFYPIEIYMPDNEGNFYKIDCRDGEAKNDPWHFGLNYDSILLMSNENYSVLMEKLHFNFDLDFELYMSFGGRNDAVPTSNGLVRLRSRPRQIKAYMLGTFESEVKARCSIEGHCNYSSGYDLWIPNPISTPDYVFAPFGVPVSIKINSDLYREVQLEADGEITAYTGFSDNAAGLIGYEWRSSTGIRSLDTTFNNFEFTPPTVEGAGSVEAKVWVIPRFRMIFYRSLGPSFDIKPYLSTTVNGGFKEEMLGQSNDFCAWSLDCNAGLDANAGLSLQFLGNELANCSTDNWNIIDKPLYHSPLRIEHNTSGNGLMIGQSNEVSFTVYDRNYLFDTDVVTPLPQLVKFEGDGEISSEYSIVQEGTVSVNWTPENNDNVLYARLYDSDGNVISEAVVGDWVDLGLPSGLLWATHNVGANSPEEYGSYISWGEFAPKSVYRWNTYNYGYEEDGFLYITKYNTDSYYGPVDNLTILQSGDDAATVNWGRSARMPTIEEWQELMNYCTTTWTSQNGVNGRYFTGPNGNSLFLPAAGCRLDSSLSETGSRGNYWSSSLYTSFPLHAWNIYIDTAGYGPVGGSYRDNGLSIRAVRSAQQN